MGLYRYFVLCVEEAGRGIWFHRRVVAPALIVMTASLVVLGAFLLASDNLNAVLVGWRERGQLQVFLEAEVTPGDRAGIESALDRAAAVEEYRFIDADEMIAEIGQSGARLVFLALGAPKQERFAARAAEMLPEVGFMSIGAGLDFISGEQKRAPLWVRKIAATP